ncbi:MAG TPA: transcriptional regulator GcvA [Candidatus Sulfotelmatobacter sp.]|nr:transcriptional regulator GcvA [Candidatus Sulfotelmatobacter sp.]
MRRLPSLNALRAFEAAARHKGFTAAAAELGVTQTAVSRLVKGLEQRFGFPLFRRTGNAVALTERGAAYLPGLSDAFDRLAAATDRVLGMAPASVLTIASGPTLAMRWLIPRLPAFQGSNPGVEVRLSTSLPVTAIDDPAPLGPGVTAAIRLGSGQWPGLAAEPLFRADMFPVAAPAVARRLKQPRDLRQHTLLHVLHAPDEWPTWLAAAAVRDIDADAGPRFDFHAFALQAALDGLGVAMARRPFVADDLAAGRLVAPFALALPKAQSWYLIYRPEALDMPAFAAFRAWLLAAA